MHKTKKNYSVNVDLKWSIDYQVKASTEAEAKQLAWEKFKRHPPKKCIELLVTKSNS